MLEPADKVRYVLMDDKTVVLTRSDDGDEHVDPVIDEFLAFLATDMQENPSNVRPVPQDLLTRARDLTDGFTVDLDAPLDPEDE
jgi:antitoxin PrlF